MRALSLSLNLGFLSSRSGLLYRMDKLSDIFTFFWYHVYRSIFSGNQACNELIQLVELLESKDFRVTVKWIFQGSCCTFSKCSLSFTHCRVNLFSFIFAWFSSTYQQLLFPCRPNFFGSIHFVIMLKNAPTVSRESLIFISFASTVLSNKS